MDFWTEHGTTTPEAHAAVYGDPLAVQLATLPIDTLRSMASGCLYPAPRLIEALRLATAAEVAQRNAVAFPSLRWVTL